MKILKQILGVITNPLKSLLGIKTIDVISKEFTKRPIWIFIVSLVITFGVVVYYYFDILFLG